MNREERKEIKDLPSKYRPLGAWSYFGYSILFNIPVIGWLFLIIFAISGSNVNRRSFARSYFCGFLIVLIIVIIAAVVFGPQIKAILTEYMEMIKQMTEQMPK